MSHLKWSDNAIRNIQKAYRFLAKHDLDAAKSMAKAIKEQAWILVEFPNAGRPTDNLDPEHRELVIRFGVSGYVLIYEVFDEYVLVLAVKHQKEAGY